MNPCVRFGLATSLVLGVGAAAAAEPPPVEVLPPPQAMTPAPALLPAGNFRTNRWDVWRYSDVDRRGYFRPVVIYHPYGSYYLYNGAPFPWVSTHLTEFTPKIMGTPNRSYMPYIMD
jgi:hypothetical protein